MQSASQSVVLEAQLRAMQAERFRHRAFQASPLEQGLAHCLRAYPGGFDHTATIDLAEQRTGTGASSAAQQMSKDNAGTVSLAGKSRSIGQQMPCHVSLPDGLFDLHQCSACDVHSKSPGEEG